MATITDPIRCTKLAGLRYLPDTHPGITRKRVGKGFRYFDADGVPIRDKEILCRIKSLAVPPAWTNVWICPNPSGHLQATGRDAKRRKQSRYHARWREVRDETKFERMKMFARALPAIRNRVEHDLALSGLPREKVLATIVRLLETTFIRVGNVEYARENHSYGLTTFRSRHVNVDGSTVRFKFQGKSGKRHAIDLTDRQVAKIVKRCLDLPGYELFQYLEEDGTCHTVDSADVNEYLHEITDQNFTAKDFRTWAGTVLACATLREIGAFESETSAKRNVVQAISSVAQRLGNTPSVCRKCYVHPAVLDCYLCGSMLKMFEEHAHRETESLDPGLRPEELDLIRLLER